MVQDNLISNNLNNNVGGENPKKKINIFGILLIEGGIVLILLALVLFSLNYFRILSLSTQIPFLSWLPQKDVNEQMGSAPSEAQNSINSSELSYKCPVDISVCSNSEPVYDGQTLLGRGYKGLQEGIPVRALISGDIVELSTLSDETILTIRRADGKTFVTYTFSGSAVVRDKDIVTVGVPVGVIGGGSVSVNNDSFSLFISASDADSGESVDIFPLSDSTNTSTIIASYELIEGNGIQINNSENLRQLMLSWGVFGKNYNSSTEGSTMDVPVDKISISITEIEHTTYSVYDGDELLVGTGVTITPGAMDLHVFISKPLSRRSESEIDRHVLYSIVDALYHKAYDELKSEKQIKDEVDRIAKELDEQNPITVTSL